MNKHLSIVPELITEPGTVYVDGAGNPTTTPRCAAHRAYAPDYCPLCGTAREIGGNR